MPTYDYARPALTVDLIVLRESEQGAQVLLIRRKGEPFQGKLALPGGFVNEGESPEMAAVRELREETNVGLVHVPQQVGFYGDPGRDPRGWVVSVAYLCRVPQGTEAVAGDDAAEAIWVSTALQLPLAFDHARILGEALVAARMDTEPW